MPMPRILENLREHLDQIEQASDWEYRFVCDQLERLEENPAARLTDKQFRKALRLHQKYVT